MTSLRWFCRKNWLALAQLQLLGREVGQAEGVVEAEGGRRLRALQQGDQAAAEAIDLGAGALAVLRAHVGPVLHVVPLQPLRTTPASA